VIDIRVVDNLYIVEGPKFRLALTREQFIAALRRAKALMRAQQRQARLPRAEEDPCPSSPCPGR
jgi:hypothetical protein